MSTLGELEGFATERVASALGIGNAAASTFARTSEPKKSR